MAVLPFLPIIVMFGLFALRIPVAFALIIAAIVYFSFINTTMPIEIMVQTLVSSTESFPYLAIPSSPAPAWSSTIPAYPSG